MGGKVRGVRDHDAEDDFDGAVVEIALDALDDDSDEETDGDTDGDEVAQAEKAPDYRGSLPLNHHGDAELESEETGGVIDQTFAFQDVDDARGETYAPGDGGGGYGVRGGHQRAKDEAKAEIKVGEGPMGGFGNPQRGKADQAESQKKDADDIVGKIAPGGKPRARVQERRENGEEDDVGAHGDFGNAGDKAEEETRNDQDDRVRKLQLAGDVGEDDDEEQQEEKDEFYGVDAAALHDCSFQRTRYINLGARLRNRGEIPPLREPTRSPRRTSGAGGK